MWWQWIILILLLIGAGLLLKNFWRVFLELKIALQGPFFAPTSDERIEQIKKLTQLKAKMTVVDLGSGDGRVLIKLATAFPQIMFIGYEIDPLLVKQSRALIVAAKLDKQIKIYNTCFWKANVSQADLIIVYCIKRFMSKLEKKLQAEMKTNSQVMSVFFQFPTWKHKHKLGDIRLYIKK